MLYTYLISIIVAGTWFLTDSFTLVDFTKNINAQNWYVVNDGVMGGLSRGYFEVTETGTAQFTGEVSLDNYGGFTSVRLSLPRPLTSEKYQKFILHIRGDGKRYQFRTKPDKSSWYAYIAYFDTAGEWETIEIPFSEMYPSFRGRKLNQPNFSGKSIEEVTFLISNKKVESFAIEIAGITLE